MSASSFPGAAMPRPQSEMECRGGGDRFYRSFAGDREKRIAFRVQVGTTDLYVRADRDLSSPAYDAARRARSEVERCIREFPPLATALAPVAFPPHLDSELVLGMFAAARAAGVGPMAAVAGAIAEEVGRTLRRYSREVIVENGGDIYLDLEQDAVVGLYAGASPFSGRLGLRVRAAHTPLAVCTSSGTIGPSLSYGSADAAVVVGTSGAVTDAVATAMGNRIHTGDDLQGAVEWALTISGIRGAVAVCERQFAAAGSVEITELRA